MSHSCAVFQEQLLLLTSDSGSQPSEHEALVHAANCKDCSRFITDLWKLHREFHDSRGKVLRDVLGEERVRLISSPGETLDCMSDDSDKTDIPAVEELGRRQQWKGDAPWVEHLLGDLIHGREWQRLLEVAFRKSSPAIEFTTETVTGELRQTTSGIRLELSGEICDAAWAWEASREWTRLRSDSEGRWWWEFAPRDENLATLVDALARLRFRIS